MYAWIWRRLPGTLTTRALIAVTLVLLVAAVLWLWIFPWAYTHLPLDSAGFAG